MPRQTTALTAVAVVAVGLATACGSSNGDGAPAGDASALFDRRAREVAAAWTRSGLLEQWRTSVVAAQALTIEPDWTPRPNLKASFGNGWVRTATALPTSPGTGSVTYDDGTTFRTRVIDAQRAYDATVNPRSGPCPPPEGRSDGCDWVTVTAARPVTTPIATVRGPARVPAWEFTVDGLSAPLVRVAVEVAEVSDFEPAGLAASPVDGRRVLLHGQDVVSHTADSLTVTLGSGDCDTERREHVLETDDVVVVGGTALAPPPGQACNAMLRLEEVTVPLRAELGDRPVLDAASGRPLLPSVVPSR